MRAIKRYYTEYNRKAVEFYKRMAHKTFTHANKAVEMLEQINAENKELRQQNKLYLAGVNYWRDQYREKADKLAILKNAVDEFIKRHPEFNKELNEIIKQEEEESEEAEE